MNNFAIIRPAWTPATIALMILGFMAFWPLGLAMLAYILWGDRLDQFKSDINRATNNVANGFRFGRTCTKVNTTGNVAFDDWRQAELERLEEERRRLDDMCREFDEHLHELRRAKDQKEFDDFMKARTQKGAGAPRVPRESNIDTGYGKA